MEPLSLAYNSKIGRNYLVLAILLSLLCVGLAFWSPVSFVLVLGAVFVGLFFSSRTFRWLIFPAVIAFNQMIYARWGVPIQYGPLSIQPVDWIALLLLAAVLLNKTLNGDKFFSRTGLERPIGFFLGALVAVSLFGIVGVKAATIGIGHITLYFLTFYAMVADWEIVPLSHLWRSYQFWGIFVAVSIVWNFLITGGGRSLGVSLNYRVFELILPVICFQLVAFTLKGGVGRLFFLGLFFLAVIGSQTRALWVGVGIVTIAWVLIRTKLGDKKLKERIVQVGSTLLILAVFLSILLLLLTPFLVYVEKRAAELTAGTGTISLRFFLWGLALKLFLLNPLTGVGLWQFPYVVAQMPEMKNISVYVYLLQGLSTHNSLLQLLAETGIVGATVFFIFCGATLQRAWRVARNRQNQEEMCLGWGLFLTLLYFISGNVYAETWIAYPFMFFLAILVIFERQMGQRLKVKDVH